MRLKLHQGFALATAVLMAAPGFAQESVSGEASEMPDLNACIADVEKGDTAAIDACVSANLDEIRAFIDSHPETAAQNSDEAEETSERDDL